MTNQNPGVLLARQDGVVELLDAVPVAPTFMADLNRTLDALGLPPAQLRIADRPEPDQSPDGEP